MPNGALNSHPPHYSVFDVYTILCLVLVIISIVFLKKVQGLLKIHSDIFYTAANLNLVVRICIMVAKVCCKAPGITELLSVSQSPQLFEGRN